jgi:hypothetical protein
VPQSRSGYNETECRKGLRNLVRGDTGVEFVTEWSEHIFKTRCLRFYTLYRSLCAFIADGNALFGS